MKSSTKPRGFCPCLEALEDRLVPALAELLYTFPNPTPGWDDRFGNSVAVSGDRVLVGAPYDDVGGRDAGAAYLYDASGNLLHTFINPTPDADDYFGWSVAMSGDRVLVGARGDDTGAEDAGAAYQYDAASGSLLRTIRNPTPVANEYFGWSVAVSEHWMLVGAPYASPPSRGGYVGEAYLFTTESGSLFNYFRNPTTAGTYPFGWSVAVSGDRVLVGAPDPGAAYLYYAASGSLIRTLPNPTPLANEGFGWSVAMSGDRVLVGAPDPGAAYLYDGNNGKYLRTFGNPNPDAYDLFGTSVAMSGDRVLVGARGDDAGAEDAGAAYLYDAASGSLLRTIRNPAPAEGDSFGTSVAVSGDRVLVGARYDDAGAYDAGAAYLFGDKPDPPPGPPPGPPPSSPGAAAPAFVARVLRRRGRARVQFLDARTGAVRLQLRFAAAVQLRQHDINGDGTPDFLLLIGKGRRRRRLAFSGRDLSPLAP